MRIRRGVIGFTVGLFCLATLFGCRSSPPTGSEVALAADNENKTTGSTPPSDPTSSGRDESSTRTEGSDAAAEQKTKTDSSPETEVSQDAGSSQGQGTSQDTGGPEGGASADPATSQDSSADDAPPNDRASNNATATPGDASDTGVSGSGSGGDSGAGRSPDTPHQDSAFEFESASSVALARPLAPDATTGPEFTFEIGSAESPIVEELRSDPLYYTSVRDVDCPQDIANDAIVCQEVTLPEDYDTPANGRTIKLMVATVDNDDPLGIGPVVYLQGGPGVGVVDHAPTYVGGTFDIILVDQRGTGLSEPMLDCTEQVETYPTVMNLESRSGRAARVDAAAERRCVKRLTESNLNLGSFTSENNAEDIALLRRVLGYEQWNLFGSSYGTRLALTVLRDHPEGVRSVVLDAVLPPEADFFGGLGENYLRALDTLNGACRDDVVCASNYGDLREAVDVAAALLDYDPVIVQVERPESGDTIDVVVDGPRFHGFVFDRLYSTASLSELPRYIHAATTGDVSALAWQSVVGSDPEGFEFSEALYWSVMCAEEVPFIDDNADKRLAARAADAIVYAFATDAFKDTCSRFDVETAPPIETEPVTTDVPILAATGSFDPVTPPAWGQALGDRLSTATFVEFTSRAHGTASSCFMNMTNAFLADPTAPVDASCANEAPITFE